MGPKALNARSLVRTEGARKGRGVSFDSVAIVLLLFFVLWRLTTILEEVRQLRARIEKGAPLTSEEVEEAEVMGPPETR